jgi:hypothetical protein
VRLAKLLIANATNQNTDSGWWAEAYNLLDTGRVQAAAEHDVVTRQAVVAAARTAEEDAERGLQRDTYKCIEDIGVAYRNTPTFTDRHDDVRGPEFGQFAIATAKPTVGVNGIEFIPTENGKWLPLTSNGNAGSHLFGNPAWFELVPERSNIGAPLKSKSLGAAVGAGIGVGGGFGAAVGAAVGDGANNSNVERLVANLMNGFKRFRTVDGATLLHLAVQSNSQ